MIERGFDMDATRKEELLRKVEEISLQMRDKLDMHYKLIDEVDEDYDTLCDLYKELSNEDPIYKAGCDKLTEDLKNEIRRKYWHLYEDKLRGRC